MAEATKLQSPSSPSKPCEEKKLVSHHESKLASTMRAEYMPPKSHNFDRKDEAKRRALFRKKVIEEIVEEINQEKLIKDPVEDYCTTYDDLFRIPGFKLPDKPPENLELHLKYPLHGPAITVWSEKIASETKEMACKLPGMTRIKDIKNPFKKNGAFTTPVYNRLDGAEN